MLFIPTPHKECCVVIEEKPEGPHNNDRNIKPAPEEHSMSRGAEAEGQAIPQRLHLDYRLNLLWYLTASLPPRLRLEGIEHFHPQALHRLYK